MCSYDTAEPNRLSSYIFDSAHIDRSILMNPREIFGLYRHYVMVVFYTPYAQLWVLHRCRWQGSASNCLLINYKCFTHYGRHVCLPL